MYLETSDELAVNEYYFPMWKDGPIFDKRQKLFGYRLKWSCGTPWFKAHDHERSENGEFSRFWKEPWEFRFKDRQLKSKDPRNRLLYGGPDLLVFIFLSKNNTFLIKKFIFLLKARFLSVKLSSDLDWNKVLTFWLLVSLTSWEIELVVI